MDYHPQHTMDHLKKNSWCLFNESNQTNNIKINYAKYKSYLTYNVVLNMCNMTPKVVGMYCNIYLIILT